MFFGEKIRVFWGKKILSQIKRNGFIPLIKKKNGNKKWSGKISTPNIIISP